MSQSELFDRITEKRLVYFDPADRPDHLGRRGFFLEWLDDGQKRVQAYFGNPQKWIDEGYEVAP